MPQKFLKVFDNQILNPQEEEKEITSKKTFLKRTSNAVKPSCFQTDR